jgi:Yip1 domain
MNTNRDNDPDIRTLLINYVAVLAAIPLVATLIGDAWYYSFLGVSVAGFAVAAAIVSYVFDIIGVFVVGFIMWKLGPSFGTSTTQVRATRLAAYIFTPFFLASIFDLIPFLDIIALLGLLYGLYILYLGLPILLGTPKDKVLVYAILTVVVTIIVYAVIGAIIAAIGVAFIGAFIFR